MLMITPGWSLNARSHADWHQNTGPRTLTSNVLSKRAGVDAERGAEVRVGGGVVDEDVEAAEALDGRGHAGVGGVDVAGVGGEDGDVAAASPAAAASSRRCLRDDSITRAPVAAISAAMARPIPFDAPVTSATFPSSRSSMSAGPYRSRSEAPR